MSGHSDGMIWSATIGGNFLYTGGEDQRLMKWDFKSSKKLVKQVKCPYKIRSLDFSSKKNLLAVGFINGVICMYNPHTLDKVDKMIFAKIKNPDQEVLNLVRFQFYGRFLAVSYAYPKPKIVFFTFDKDLKNNGDIELKDKVISFDITKTDKEPFYIRINCSSDNGETFEMFEFGLDRDKIRSKEVKERVIKSDWHTHTCPFSPQTQGFISEGVE